MGVVSRSAASFKPKVRVNWNTTKMPPKRSRAKAADARKPAAAAKKPRVAGKKAGPWKMPPPLPAGEVLCGHDKSQWVLGASVGKGGFGEIYLASPAAGKSPMHVVKVEPEENGPLFSELSFYRRPLASEDSIKSWASSHKLPYLAVPRFVAAGRHTRGKTSYRFLVMDRFGEDIEKKFCQADRKFSLKTVCYIALRLLEALEYLHESEYVHADIKGSNLLTGCDSAHQHEVVLVDYGLAYRYRTGQQHKAYKEDPRTAHDGTVEFTSIDAHKGVAPSRRGDLEILGYCLLQWLCGALPWEGRLEDKPYVAAQKIKYKSDVGGLMAACFHSTPVLPALREYMKAVFSLGYEETPNYAALKKLFTRELTAAGLKDDGKGLDWMATATRKRKSSDEIGSPAKKLRKSPRIKRKKPPLRSPSPEAQPSPPSQEPRPPARKKAAGKILPASRIKKPIPSPLPSPSPEAPPSPKPRPPARKKAAGKILPASRIKKPIPSPLPSPSPEAPPSPKPRPPARKKAAGKILPASRIKKPIPSPLPSPSPEAPPSPKPRPPARKKPAAKRLWKANCSPGTASKLPAVSYPKELGYKKSPTETKRKARIKAARPKQSPPPAAAAAADVIVLDGEGESEREGEEAVNPRRRKATARSCSRKALDTP